jgi:hypothetical protein
MTQPMEAAAMDVHRSITASFIYQVGRKILSPIIMKRINITRWFALGAYCHVVGDTNEPMATSSSNTQ